MKQKIGIYLPVKSSLSDRDYSSSLGLIKEGWRKKIIKKMEKKFSEYEIINNIDFKNFSIMNDQIYYENKPLKLNTYFWYSHINLDYDSYHLHVLKHLHKTCRVVKNPFGEEIGIDKFKSHQILKFNGFDVADYLFISSRNLDFAKKILKKWKRIVVKPRLGNYGVGVMLIKDYPTLRDLFGTLRENTNKEEVELLVERFYPHSMKDWISVVVFNHKSIYGYRKKPHKFVEGWKVYDDNKIGGDPSTVDYVNPPEKLKRASEEASKVMNADAISFDFIKTGDTYKIVDENTKPGLYEKCFKKARIPVEDAFLSLML